MGFKILRKIINLIMEVIYYSNVTNHGQYINHSDKMIENVSGFQVMQNER